MSARSVYYWYNALLGLGMGATGSVYAPFLYSIGLSLGEIALVNTIFWIVIIAAELPTGMLADGRSRAWSLKVGMLFSALGGLVYFFACGFWTAAMAEILLGFSNAFMSGAQQAWIADALAREGKSHELRTVYANDTLIRTPLIIVGALLGSTLALVSYRLIWIPIIITALIAIALSHRHMNGQGEPIERMTELEAFKASWKHLHASRALKWVIATMIVYGTVVTFNNFWGLYFEPIVKTSNLGWVYVFILLVYMPAGLLVRRLSIGAGHEGSMIVLSLFLTGVGLLLIPLTTGFVAPFLMLGIHEFGRGMIQPLTDSFVAHRVQSSYRATFGSLQSFLGRAGFAIVPLIVWIGVDGKPDTSETIAVVWLLSGSAIVLGACALYLTRPRRL